MATKQKSKLSAAQLAKIQKDIDKKNKLFDSMKPHQRRVAIAKDVLDRIKSKIYKPLADQYLTATKLIDPKKLDGANFQKQQLCSVLLPKPQNCSVCARGALFLSSVYKFDKCKIKELNEDLINYYAEEDRHYIDDDNGLYSYDLEKQESRFFSEEQILLIETMFERGDKTTLSDYETVEAAIAYGEDFDTDRKRLIEICNNIIRNKGEFIVPDEYFPEQDDEEEAEQEYDADSEVAD